MSAAQQQQAFTSDFESAEQHPRIPAAFKGKRWGACWFAGIRSLRAKGQIRGIVERHILDMIHDETYAQKRKPEYSAEGAITAERVAIETGKDRDYCEKRLASMASLERRIINRKKVRQGYVYQVTMEHWASAPRVAAPKSCRTRTAPPDRSAAVKSTPARGRTEAFRMAPDPEPEALTEPMVLFPGVPHPIPLSEVLIRTAAGQQLTVACCSLEGGTVVISTAEADPPEVAPDVGEGEQKENAFRTVVRNRSANRLSLQQKLEKFWHLVRTQLPAEIRYSDDAWVASNILTPLGAVPLENLFIEAATSGRRPTSIAFLARLIPATIRRYRLQQLNVVDQTAAQQDAEERQRVLYQQALDAAREQYAQASPEDRADLERAWPELAPS